ncbi:MAG: NAD(P)-binding domain-containing protein, partial [Microvirga sp.]
MTTSRPPVAFLGIGLMGSRQATRLLQAGYRLTAWNRSRSKAEALAPLGAVVVEDPGQAVADADVVVLMLENGTIVREVLFGGGGVAKALRPGTIVVDMSSIKPAEAQDHAGRLAGRGIHHIDAPVSGGTLGAEQGTLAIMAGGEPDIFARIEPLLAVMGRPVHV